MIRNRLNPLVLILVMVPVVAFAASLVENAKITGTSQVASGTLTINSGASFVSSSGSTVNISAGTVTLPSDVTRLGSSIDLSSEVTGSLPWASVNKTGSSLADLVTRSASDLSTGTLPDLRFPATLPAVSGANLTNLNGSNISTGTVSISRLPLMGGATSGTPGTAGIVAAPAAGDEAKFWRADGTWATASGGGGGSTDFLGLTDTPNSYSGQALKFVRVNSGETALEFVTSALPYLIYSDTKTDGTDAGAATTGSWFTRTLNAEDEDTAAIGSLSSNQITLPAGTYRVRARVPSVSVERFTSRLYNVTASAVLLPGTSQFASGSTTPVGDAVSEIIGRFTLGSSSAIRIEEHVPTASTHSGQTFALGANDTVTGTTERYTVIEIWKERLSFAIGYLTSSRSPIRRRSIVRRKRLV